MSFKPQRRDFITSTAALSLGLPAAAQTAGASPLAITMLHDPAPSPGWRLGLKDLKKYLEAAGLQVRLQRLSPSAPWPKGSVVVLMEDKPAFAAFRTRHGLAREVMAPDAFSIRTLQSTDSPDALTYVLQAGDKLGEQFCCYDFLERYAGIRFLHPDFEHIPRVTTPPGEINVAASAPAFKFRGLYPWHYNYDSRGLTTFCDINARFEKKDWPWVQRLGDWLVKNKQNTLFWFDDVFDDNAISSRFPKALKRHWRDRGLRQVMGLGWASNEGRPLGGRWEALTCVDTAGKSIETAEWRKALCPRVPEYRLLAERNISEVDFKAPEAIGALIGYGENTWAAHQSSLCFRHAGITGDSLMVRDLRQVKGRLDAMGLHDMPLGFVISTHSAGADSPFVSGKVLQALPRNGLVSLHVYQQDNWRHFAPIYAQLRERNVREKANLKAVQIAEVAFLCNYDIPLFRPSILRRRECDLRGLPREDVVAHLTTLNTTQYLYWLKSYQLMRWQWHQPATSWGEDITALGTDVFGQADGQVFAELVGRFTALDHLRPLEAVSELLGSLKEPATVRGWTRYNPVHHDDAFGFYLWAKEASPALLDDAEKNVAACLRLNEALARSSSELYRAQFFHTFAVTAHYHAIRIHCGQADAALAAARAEPPGPARAAHLDTANAALTRMLTARRAFDVHLRALVPGTGQDETTTRSVHADFVRNPSVAWIESRLQRLAQAMKDQSKPLGLFA